MDSDSQSYYSILNVPPSATDAEIKRSYKQLAQTFHPDKHSSQELRDRAADGFAQINEAYEVLIDPQKRQVYDIYGKMGLVAGLDVGSKLKSVEELKAEWEKFRSRTEGEVASEVNHSSHLQCTVDCTGLLDTQLPSSLRAAEIESILIQSTLDKQINPNHIGWLGGNVMRQGDNGGGNLLAGCKGIIDSKTGYTAQLQWGTKSEIGFQTMHQLRDSTQGVISTSYSVHTGPGLSFSSTQSLTETARGSAALVVGPPQEAGVQLALSQRLDDISVSTKLQVGAMYSWTGRVTKVIKPGLSVRAIGRVGFSGIDADVGVVKKLSDTSSVSVSVVYGLQGTYLKSRWMFGSFSIDLPIIFSKDPEEWKVALAAVTLAPLSYTVARHLVVKPLIQAYRSRQARMERLKHTEIIKKQMATAEAAQKLQKPVAQRKAKEESLNSGLVILKAEFGIKSKSHELIDGSDMPPPVIDVTYAVQYLVNGSKLELYPGVRKSGMMGFCDVAPGQPKTLRIQYLYKNRAYSAEVDDLEGLTLPRDGVLIRNLHEAEDLYERAKASGFESPPASSSV